MKRKVLFLTDGLGQGGAERQMFLTASNLSHEWTVAVWSLHDGVFRGNLEDSGIEVSSPLKAGYLGASSSILQTFRQFQPDIVHAWGSASLLLGCLLFRWRVPFVNGTVRRSFMPEKVMSRFRLYFTSRLGDITISNSQAAIAALGLSKTRHFVIHNGFSPDRIKAIHPVPMDTGKVNVVMCANVKPGKDYPLLVSVALKLFSEYGNSLPYKFWCLGGIVDRNYYSRLTESARELISGGHMEFTGLVDSPADYLVSADIGVLFSHSRFHAEGISNSIMEYMAAGLPVICSDSGGNREVVADGITGFVAEKEEEVVSRLQMLKSNRILAEDMGRKGRERIESEFSLGKMIQATEKVYTRLLQG